MALSDGLIHYYDCDQVGGNLTDRIGTLHMTGTTGSTPTAGFLVPPTVPGRNGGGDYALYGLLRDVAGGDAFAYVADQADVRFAVGQEMTIGFWFYVPNDGNTHIANVDHYLVSDEKVTWFGSPSFQGAWGFHWEWNTGSSQFKVHADIVFDTGSTLTLNNVNNQFPDNASFLDQWHTVFLTFDGVDQFTLYVDCEADDPGTVEPAPYGSDFHLTIGGNWITNPTATPHGQGAAAYLDEVGFWDRVLTEEEMGLMCDGESPLPPLPCGGGMRVHTYIA